MPIKRKNGSSAAALLPMLILIALLVVLVGLLVARKNAARAESVSEVSAFLAATPGIPEPAGLSASQSSQSDTPAGPEATGAPETTPEPTATPVPVTEYFTISMVGDCTLAEAKTRRGWGSAYQSVVGKNYAFPFANTVSYFSQDYLSIANLECSLSDNYYDSIEQFVFLGPSAYANILSEGSIKFVTLANNHTMDFGVGAYSDTVASLNAANVASAGEDEIYIYQREDGLKVGIYCLYGQLTYNAMSIRSGLDQAKLVSSGKEKISNAAQSLQQAGAEYLVACLHMGREGYYETTDTQVEVSRHAIDQGFDLVCCSHAHRLQPAESYGGGMIFYGLGNWSFGGHTNPGNGTDAGAYDTGIAQVTVRRTGDEIALDSYTFIPCCISSSAGTDLDSFTPNPNTLNNYQPTPYLKDGAAWKRAMSMLNGTYEGANYTTDYGNVLTAMNS